LKFRSINPTEIKAKKPPKIEAKQTTKRIILQSNAITEILDTRIILRSKVCEVARSFFKAMFDLPLIHGLFNIFWDNTDK